ncbi:MAG: BMP family ABC transporter substrate-binding protein [Chloroflexota bacterium]|nr:BMP family ABC transporter substrate-binding protein [Chloroflexota bacterium]MDQ3691284.1 BMP family ABC transporter substrate-binding protein [Chloroflexota bacterium]
MHQKRSPLSLLLVLALVAVACNQAGGPTGQPSAPGGTASQPSAEPSPEPSGEDPSGPPASGGEAPTCDTPVRVGLVTDVGRVNDKGFNQSAYEGMLAAEEAAPTCFETDFIETTSQSDYARNIAEFAENDYDVVIGVGFLLGDSLGDAAMEFSEAKFISVDGVPGEGHDESWATNGESLFFAEDQAGYLAGVLAASITESNVIGVVGGLLVVPPVERFVEGYINGAEATNPDIEVKFTYTSSFVEPEQGKAAAQQMIDEDADVIFAAGGLTGTGALIAACDADMLAIGVDTDQYETLPEAQSCLVSSATKNIVKAVQDSLLRIAAGEFTPGFHTDDASTNGIGLAPYHDQADKVTPEIQTLLDETFDGLADGSIETGVVVDGKTE